MKSLEIGIDVIRRALTFLTFAMNICIIKEVTELLDCREGVGPSYFLPLS